MKTELQTIRQRIEHEDNLISQRLSALLGSQAFLVTAFAVSLNAPPTFVREGYARANHLLTWFIPCGGIAIVLTFWSTTFAAVWSLVRLRRAAEKWSTPEDFPVHSPTAIRWLGLSAPILIPVVLLVLWIPLLTCCG